MRYCSKCGRKLSDDDAFCPGCGNRMNRKSHTNAPSHPTEKKTDQRKVTQPSTDHHTDNHRIKPEQADPNAVQYVYVNKKTGKITNNPNVKTKSEGCLQYVGIAFASVALVIVMVSGTVLLTNYLSDSPVDSDDDRIIFTLNRALEKDDKVIMLRVSSGQRFIVLSRIFTRSDETD